LIVIGEAAARLPVSFRNKYSDLAWEDIIGFRNIAVHEYFAILWEIVWDTAIHDVPFLRAKAAHIMVEEFQEE
jgi:uncharacterized protein with HEPN domain